MAVLESLRSFFIAAGTSEPEVIVPAPPTTYSTHPLMSHDLNEVLRLNIRCFPDGDNYTKHTFEYLLNKPKTLSYRVVSASGDMVAFAFVMINENGSAHLTTIGVAPEHRGRGLAARLLSHIEKAVKDREIGTIVLEVRVSNVVAQALYIRHGFNVVQRIVKYYNNGEDCYLMMKPLV